MQTERHARPALPLLALLAAASALGVAVAIALAAVAMLLAAPAYAEPGGLLLERPAGAVPARLLFSEVESHGEGHRRVVEAYHNPFDEALAGVYLYRLPANAVLERLVFTPLTVGTRHALLVRRQGSTVVEPTAEIGPGETVLVELEYRRTAVRRLLALR